jgi:hypothetical protein
LMRRIVRGIWKKDKTHPIRKYVDSFKSSDQAG